MLSWVSSGILFPLVKHIQPGPAHIHNLRAAIPVLLQQGALPAVVGIGDSDTSTDDAATLLCAKVALVADAHLCGWPHVRVTKDTLSIAFLAQPSNC